MRVLVTGSAGTVGSALVPLLADRGHDVVELDRVHGSDVLDRRDLESALAACDAVVHLAALLEPVPGEPDALIAVNLLGSAHVLTAARDLGVRRAVLMSSAAATGVFRGEGAPDYLPLDEDHPDRPASAYAVSKLGAELVAEEVSRATGMTVVALRPPGVWTGETYRRVRDVRLRDPSYEWSPYWEYGAFIDVRDLATATLAALTADVGGFTRLLVASSDLSTSGPTALELVREIHPEVEWRGGASHERDPYATLVSIDRARRVLGWEPLHTWRRFMTAGRPTVDEG